MRVRLNRLTDEWFESEESPARAMVVELQRIRRRTRTRWLPVVVLGLFVAGALTYKLATRAEHFEAEIVLALTEGSLSAKHNGLPVEELRQFVDGVLIPDAKLRALIERRDLYRMRKVRGMEYAIEELRGQLEVEIWKNSFVYYDEDAANAEHSARIGLTVADSDPDRAYELAHDIAAIVIETAHENRQQLNEQLSAEIAARRDGLRHRLDQAALEAAEKSAALTRAHAKHEEDLAQALSLQLVELAAERKHGEKALADIAVSRDAVADRIATAGLDTSIAIVEETRPERPDHRGFAIAMVAVVIGIGSLLGAALVLGAFDSRIHDGDDVERLGLPMLGHVPGFAGDGVGSLAARVPSTRSRWRSHP